MPLLLCSASSSEKLGKDSTDASVEGKCTVLTFPGVAGCRGDKEVEGAVAVAAAGNRGEASAKLLKTLLLVGCCVVLLFSDVKLAVLVEESSRFINNSLVEAMGMSINGTSSIGRDRSWGRNSGVPSGEYCETWEAA